MLSVFVSFNPNKFPGNLIQELAAKSHSLPRSFTGILRFSDCLKRKFGLRRNKRSFLAETLQLFYKRFNKVLLELTVV